MSLVIGEIVNGKYRIVRLMGGGGMGAVYQAIAIGSEARVAIKVIHTGDLAKDRSLIGRFQREVKATSSIDTEHIVRVIETGQRAETGHPFMVMEYLEGEDLSHVFKRLGPLSPEVALRIIAQVCLGLDQAHAARIVHRDIKPANLFLATQPDGTLSVKVLDFGIAKVTMDRANLMDSKSLTQTGSMLGSPLYMSPEQARGNKSIDHRTDIWSLGIVLYQALTGRTPNQDIDALGELIIAICSELATPVQQFAPWVSPEVAAIVHRALCFDPAERFQSAGEMAEALMRLLPKGLSLRPEQVVSVDPEERARVAPTLPLPRSNPPSPLLSSSDSRRITAGGGARMISRPAINDLELSSSRLDASLPEAGTPLGLANSPVAPASPAKDRLAPLFLGIVTALGVGFGLYKLMAPGAPGPTSPGSTTPPSLASPRAATPSAATPSASLASETGIAAPAPPTASAASPSGRARAVTVTIAPGDAKVEVDGASVQTKGGAIEITGNLGSVHQVRVTRGAAKVLTDVVITEAGAKPPRIELETGVQSVRPRPPASTPTSAPTSTFKDTFE